jgi:hypothetical protein
MFVKQHRLPFEPLLKVFNNEITVEDFAKVAEVTADTVWNWKKHGVPEPQADRVAVRLGLHPASVWGDAWWSLANLPALRDGGTSTDPTAPKRSRHMRMSVSCVADGETDGE